MIGTSNNMNDNKPVVLVSCVAKKRSLSIEAKENRLTIRGEKQTNGEEQTGEVLYRGIAARTFERNYQLADHVEVKGARLANGLLHVDLVREIPEAMKPRVIPIASSSKLLEVKPQVAA